MKTWLVAIWDSLRSGFWFVPTVITLLAFVVAVAMPAADVVLEIEKHPYFSWLATTASAGRATLASLVGALVTVAGVVFSVTMVTLSLTASQFGSRLLRTFMNQNVTQITLGAFLATSIYCLVILKALPDEDGAPLVPHLSVALGMILGVTCLCLLIYFIHHVARSIQAQEVVRDVAHELEDAIGRLFPQEDASEGPEAAQQPSTHLEKRGKDARSIPARRQGYLQAVDTPKLIEIACEHDLVLELSRRPGHFITRKMPLVQAWPGERCPDGIDERINAAFVTGSRRTPRQDVECAIDELVEVAVRALSPGINDPVTAMACVDYLGAAMCALAERKRPSPLRHDKQGQVRVITPVVAFPAALDAAFNQIRQYGERSVAVTVRMLEALIVIAKRVRREEDRQALRRHGQMLERSAEAHFREEHDRASVRERAMELRSGCAGAAGQD